MDALLRFSIDLGSVMAGIDCRSIIDIKTESISSKIDYGFNGYNESLWVGLDKERCEDKR
ncbi:hypothetical protein Pst134EB_003787 [Puccinia striiformis f. sp. tritici]|nr:hypothetical protein Pst134EB_003787 [Puccinia striiformis f. sp. tritici]